MSVLAPGSNELQDPSGNLACPAIHDRNFPRASRLVSLTGRGGPRNVQCPLYVMMVLVVAAAGPVRAESGLASYYGGAGKHGEMTCAHRTRPLGTIVTVTHGGRSIRCRINDRGPFVRGRIIDVSRSAARALNMLRSGVVRVSVQ